MVVGKTSYEKGFEIGFEIGLKTGYIIVLLAQVQKLFGPLSVAAEQRLQAMSLRDLERVADDLFMADSLAELGLEEKNNGNAAE
jgi:hypothetical protein